MRIQPFTLGEVATNTYVVYDYGKGNEAYMIDAPDGIAKALGFIREKGLTLTHVLLTHAHFDHVLGLGEIRKEFPLVRIFVDKADDFFLRAKGEGNIELLNNGFPFMLSAFSPYLEALPSEYEFYGEKILSYDVIRIPGHTKGSVCLYDRKENIIFSGDTIFKSSYGRTDFPGGSQSELFSSIKRLLKESDDNALVLPGHGERTTIKEEKAFYGL